MRRCLSRFRAGITKKAAGGPVAGKVPIIVGERGPELFMPGSVGNIIPNDQLGSGSVAVETPTSSITTSPGVSSPKNNLSTSYTKAYYANSG